MLKEAFYINYETLLTKDQKLKALFNSLMCGFEWEGRLKINNS